jgi:hypothetical protein
MEVMMDNPFPGMNPYLEQPDLWHQVHNRLIVAIADDLTPKIVPQYRVSIEERIYTSVDDSFLVGIADVAVNNRHTGNLVTMEPQTTSQPQLVQLPMPIEVTERYLEIRAGQEVICVIEVLSPKNKRAGEGRTAYESKRQRILMSATHLVEIDLLRTGEPITILGNVKPGYGVLVSRSYQRPQASLYSVTLPERLPTFPIPLRAGQPEPTIDLQQLLNDLYQRARLDLAIDYNQPLKPPLAVEEQQWLEKLPSKL